jgi:hypothetical protein
MHQAMALPLKMVCLAKGKYEMVSNKNKNPCLIILEMISTGKVNLKIP